MQPWLASRAAWGREQQVRTVTAGGNDKGSLGRATAGRGDATTAT
jgi:hypothetical protein